MKPNHLLTSLTACVFIASAAVSSLAQRANPPAQNAASEPRPAAAALAPTLGPIANVLTDEQRASFRKNMAAQRERMRNLQTQLREARRDLLAASVSGTFDEQNIRPKAMAVARMEAQLAVQRARAVSQIQPPLTAEQKEKIMNSLPSAGRVGSRALNGERRRGPANTTNRDENNLPPKQ